MAAALIGLLVIAAGSGLFLDVYRHETAFASNGYRGADVISLALVAPLLVWAGWRCRLGSVRGQLLWLGALGYVTYQYGYTFAYRWNRLFLVYLGLLVLAGYTLASALIHIDPSAIAARFGTDAPVRATAGFLTAVGAGLALIEVGQIIPTIFTGAAPKLVVDTGHLTSPIYILDLGLVVPSCCSPPGGCAARSHRGLRRRSDPAREGRHGRARPSRRQRVRRAQP